MIVCLHFTANNTLLEAINQPSAILENQEPYTLYELMDCDLGILEKFPRLHMLFYSTAGITLHRALHF